MNEQGKISSDASKVIGIMFLLVVLTLVTFSSDIFGYGSGSGNRRLIFLPPPTVQRSTTTQIALGRNNEPLINPGLRFQFGRSIGYGYAGSDVARLQQTLKDQGFYVPPVSGFFGLFTYQSLIAFQNSRSLTPTGYLDVVTRSVLNTLVK
jgi:peptidoglycan hydrolase-like protein with peptidoglycan-binding domain